MAVIAPLRRNAAQEILPPDPLSLARARGAVRVDFTNDRGFYHVARVQEFDAHQDRFRDKAHRLITHLQEGVARGHYLIVGEPLVNHLPPQGAEDGSSVLEVVFASV